MFVAQQTVNFNFEGAVRFKNFSSRNRMKLKLVETESPLSYLYGTTIKVETNLKMVKILKNLKTDIRK